MRGILMNIQTYVIESLREYIEIINEKSPDFSLSRGQIEDKPLLPSALRKDDRGNRIFSNSTVKQFIEDFKNDSLQYIAGHGTDLKNDFEWMIYAQHFGIPTRLLDFTYSHMVSLMFAVEKAFDLDDDGNSVVWLLNYRNLNYKAVCEEKIVNLSEHGNLEQKIVYPCVVTARKINPRVIAQNGLFVLFEEDFGPLEEIDIAADVLKKIIIPHSCARHVLADLYAMGMRFDKLYPELASIAKDILLKHNVLEFYRMGIEDE